MVSKFLVAGVPEDSAGCANKFLDAVMKAAADAQLGRRDGGTVQVKAVTSRVLSPPATTA